MTVAYKLTDDQGRTHGRTQWGAGVTHEAPGRGVLCSPGWLHCYDSPWIAVLMDPIHAEYLPLGQMWVAERSGQTRTDGTKRGVQRLTTVEQMSLPVLTTAQRVRVAIAAARLVTPASESEWHRWADLWDSGTDRTAGGVSPVASAAARAAAWAAARAAARDAARAAAGAVPIDLHAIIEQAIRDEPAEVPA